MPRNTHPLVDTQHRPTLEIESDLQSIHCPIDVVSDEPLDELEHNPATSGTVVVEILAPQQGSVLAADRAILLRASASDGPTDLSDQIRWRSNINGLLGLGKKITAELSSGVHTLSASIPQPGGRLRATIGVAVPTYYTDPTCFPCDDC